jgi:N-acetylglucosamine-6-phosphate deacetylase
MSPAPHATLEPFEFILRHLHDEENRSFDSVYFKDPLLYTEVSAETDVESFELFGLPCYKTNQAAYLTSGKLAGSVLTMNQAVKNAKEYLDVDLIALSKIASTNAAKSLKLNDRGVLEKGKLADIVLLNENLDVVDVFKNGIKVF